MCALAAQAALDDLETVCEAIFGIDPDFVAASCDRRALDRRDDRRLAANFGFSFNATGEARENVALVDECVATLELALGVELSEAR